MSRASSLATSFSTGRIAKIFLGEITQWDDPAIKALNEKIALPALDITVVHRSDGSGTTYNFTNYLAKASLEWKSKIGFEAALERQAQ